MSKYIYEEDEYETEDHTHCKICDIEIAVHADICGECACEDDCAY
ncbi:hypothetical protein LCGC14_3011920 [marine sediment metagenome]|uniref:Uncharacterized protein n=1 Tax=marine sediment metagenome TaxID=412755 RepID=A0A0F8Z5K5_9ZZZZ